jgi:hypothetical protein
MAWVKIRAQRTHGMGENKVDPKEEFTFFSQEQNGREDDGG